MSIINQPIFQNEAAAREYLESLRWPEGPICPHCGNIEGINELKGKSHRKGLYKCRKCRRQFTVTVKTLFERSKIPLNMWLLTVYLLCSSEKGISSSQLHRTLGVTYKTAWFMTHRIREVMSDPVFTRKLGGKDKIVKVDETSWGNKGKHLKGARAQRIQFSIEARKELEEKRRQAEKQYKRLLQEAEICGQMVEHINAIL